MSKTRWKASPRKESLGRDRRDEVVVVVMMGIKRWSSKLRTTNVKPFVEVWLYRIFFMKLQGVVHVQMAIVLKNSPK